MSGEEIGKAAKVEEGAAEAADRPKGAIATATAAVATIPVVSVKSQDICKKSATLESRPEVDVQGNLIRTPMK